jgi:RNA polymerase sigma factor (sigma-70 family)
MEESADKVYTQHKGLIRALVHSIVVNNPAVVSTEDLQQAGALALMIALKSYNPSLGSFQSYIRRCIRHALLEQANTFNGVFTVDEKIRRQANAVVRLRKEGLSDDAIMDRLGIKTRATFLSLLDLVSATRDVENVDVAFDETVDENNIMRILDEIGLEDAELRFVNLVISNHSMENLETEMELGRSQLYKLRASIRDKILAWGQQ